MPVHGGRIVKTLGDGLMAELKTASEGVGAANAMHEWMARHCEPLRNGETLGLRAGIHAAKIFSGTTGIYGMGVNLASRVATLAGAGETVATAPFRDRLSDSLGAEIEDLGDCHLKHVDRPVRAFRLGPAQHALSLPTQREEHLNRCGVRVPDAREFALLLIRTDTLADGSLQAELRLRDRPVCRQARHPRLRRSLRNPGHSGRYQCGGAAARSPARKPPNESADTGSTPEGTGR